ncbi:uncharacterized protein LOC106774697 [Vigna radiata var. radiata]|uniref:Uncharacterized protein LOC106774695 n=1 Tax=Vigna radiata var. radiata TaxID=3916 RepID=A0A1S3VFU1_VIGRR|nr:uncharacterized protein LOC106774695 [Vigna radiata var. radiata]XP_014517228.1 uncharacterized protein LOC106774697 [Vigna radiata var. radiata]
MALNENETQSEKGVIVQKRGVLQLTTEDALLAQNKLLSQQLDNLSKIIAQLPKELRNVSQAQQQLCDLCGSDHVNGQCAFPEKAQEEANYLGNQFQKPQPPLRQQVANLTEHVRSLDEKFKKFLKVYDSHYKSHEANFRNLETQIDQSSKRVEITENNQFRANIEVNPRGDCKVVVSMVEERGEKEIIEIESNEDEMEEEKKIEKKNESYLPYLRREEIKKNNCGYFREIFNQMKINMPSTEALQQRPVYSKHIKYYLGEIIDLEEEDSKEQEGCMHPLKKKHPPKMKDPGSLTIPCAIGNVNVGRALLDSGSGINLMPLCMLKKIGGLTLKPTNMFVVVADGSSKRPYGVVEDAVIRVEHLEFLVDFVVMEMKADEMISLILGRPFMKTAKVVISVHDGLVMSKDQEHKLILNDSEEKMTRIQKRAKYNASRKDTKSANTGNNCDFLQVWEEEDVDKGGTVHVDLEDSPF